MVVSRLAHIPGIGVNVVGDRADAAGDASMLRLENLDTDLRPPAVAVATTRGALEDDAANSVGARAAEIELALTTGETRSGAIFLEVSLDRPRVLDFLNRFDQRFLTLYTDDGVRLVNVGSLERVRQLD